MKAFNTFALITLSLAPSALCTERPGADRTRVEHALSALGLPFSTLRSSDPHSEPLDPLFDFETFSLESPMGLLGIGVDAADQMHARALRWAGVSGATAADDSADLLVSGSAASAHAADAGQEADLASDLRRLGRADVLLGDTDAREALRKEEELTVSQAVKVSHESELEGDLLAEQSQSQSEAEGEAEAEAAGEQEGKNYHKFVSASTYSILTARAEVPIPAFPAASVVLSLLSDTIMSRNFRYISSITDLSLGVGFPPAKPVVRLSAIIGGKVRVTASGSSAEAMTMPSMLLLNYHYGLYANADNVKNTFKKATKGMAGLLQGDEAPNTPAVSSDILEDYADGFEQEYVSLFSDEWTYVTGSAAEERVNRRSRKRGPPSRDVADVSERTVLRDIQIIEELLSEAPASPEDNVSVWRLDSGLRIKASHRGSQKESWSFSVRPDGPWTKITREQSAAFKEVRSSHDRAVINALRTVYAVLADELPESSNDGDVLVAAAEGRPVGKSRSDQNNDDDDDDDDDDGEKPKRSLSSTVSDAVATAKEILVRVKSEWRELKARVGRGIRESGAFRVAKRSWFKGPRKPMRVFEQLAARMSEEGFSRKENAVERALFTADAHLFGDYTRVLSIREALFAFCKENAGVEGILEHFRTAVSKDEEFLASTRTETDVPDKMKEDEEANGGDDLSAKDPLGTFVEDKDADPSGLRPVPLSESGVRVGRVRAEMARKRRRRARSDRKLLDDKNAHELFGLLSDDILERYSHIEHMAKMTAKRLKKLGDPEWDELSDKHKREFRRYFFSLRRLAGDLLSRMRALNSGNSPIVHALVKGTSWLGTKVEKSCDAIKAAMKAKLEENDWRLNAKFYYTVQLGFDVNSPLPPPLPGKVIFNPGYSCGVARMVSTRYLDDKGKTFGSTYCGPAVDSVVVGKGANGPPPYVFVLRSETRTFTDHTYCHKLFGRSPCTQTFWMLLTQFPTSFGLKPSQFVPVIRALTTAGVADDIYENEIMKERDGKKDSEAESEEEDLLLAAPDAPDTDEQDDSDDNAVTKAVDMMKPPLAMMMPQMFGADADKKDEVVPDDESGDAIKDKAREAFNFVKNYGPTLIATFIPLPSQPRLGAISFMNTYILGDGEGAEKKIVGVDSMFIKLFIMQPIFQKAVGKIKDSIAKIIPNINVNLELERGIVTWPVFPGAACRRVARLEGTNKCAAAKDAASKGEITEGAANLATSSAVESRSGACTSALSSSVLNTLREAVHRAASDDGGKVRNDVIDTLHDLESACR